jgi:hypothetical protein
VPGASRAAPPAFLLAEWDVASGPDGAPSPDATRYNDGRGRNLQIFFAFERARSGLRSQS